MGFLDSLSQSEDCALCKRPQKKRTWWFEWKKDPFTGRKTRHEECDVIEDFLGLHVIGERRTLCAKCGMAIHRFGWVTVDKVRLPPGWGRNVWWDIICEARNTDEMWRLACLWAICCRFQREVNAAK